MRVKRTSNGAESNQKEKQRQYNFYCPNIPFLIYPTKALIPICKIPYSEQWSYRIACWITWILYHKFLCQMVPTWFHLCVWWRWYGFSKSNGGNHLFHCILSGNGSGRENGSVLSKDVIDPKDTSLSLLYPPALGTIPIGYWASRAVNPSSKAVMALGSTH